MILKFYINHDNETFFNFTDNSNQQTNIDAQSKLKFNNNSNVKSIIDDLYLTMFIFRYSPMASDLATLATSTLVNPFASAHSQLTSHLSGLNDQSAAALVASAASMLPVVANRTKTSFVTAGSGVPGSGLGFGTTRVVGSAPFLTPSALDQHAHRLAAATGNLSGWCLFVYNLAPEVEENVIWKLFGPFGAVQQVNLVKDAQTNKCRGFAFVTMSDYNQALMAIQSLNGYTLANRVLQVSFKTSKVRKTMQ